MSTLLAYSQCFKQRIFQDRSLRNHTCNYPLHETWTSNYYNDSANFVSSFCPHTGNRTSQANRHRLYPSVSFPNSAILPQGHSWYTLSSTYWLFLIKFWFFMCPEMCSKRTCSILHPSEADWSALPSMILLDFFEYGGHISLSAVVADCLQSPWPFKDIQCSLSRTLSVHS